jgi:hypothetical protein
MKKKGLLETRGLSPLFVLFFFFKQWQHIKFDSFFSLSPPRGAKRSETDEREKESSQRREKEREYDERWWEVKGK